MKLLALDTSSTACSVALSMTANEACDSDTAASGLIERHEEQPREHTRILLPMIREVLAEANVEPGALDALVLGNGPGSFIGMRIAASVAQGLARASGLAIVPVSSLAAVAAEAFAAAPAEEVIVAQDAHMDEIYLGIFGRDEAGLPVALSPERLCPQGPVAELHAAAGGRRVAAGFGWRRYPALREANAGRIDEFLAISHPRARFLLGPAAAAVRRGELVRPRDVEPAYLRQQVARKPGGSP